MDAFKNMLPALAHGMISVIGRFDSTLLVVVMSRCEMHSLFTVIRDGREMEIPARDLVPGDVIRVSTGDKVGNMITFSLVEMVSST